MGNSSSFFFLAIAFQLGQLVFVGDVDLGRHHDHRLFGEVRAEAVQFAHDHFDILDTIGTSAGIRHIDQVNQQPRALDVSQKLRAQSRAARARPRSSPGMSATTKLISFFLSPTTTTPRFGCSVVKG